MSKHFIIIFISFFVIITPFSYCEARFELSDNLINFKDVKRGEKPVKRFTITNTSGNMLDIYKIHLSCSCLKAYYKKQALLPGQSMNVDITFDSRFKNIGQSHYRIFIRASDSDMPMTHIDVIAYVTSGRSKSLLFTPEKINFGTTNPYDKIAKEIFITNNGKRPYKILSVKAGYGIDIPTYPENPILPGRTIKIPVYLYTWLKPGEIRTDLIIRTDDPLMPEFFCAVNGKIFNRNKKK